MSLNADAFAIAALAPAVVWLLWRGQTLSVELLRWRLVKLTRAKTQRWLYYTVSAVGVFVHEASHALVLLLSGHGIRGFKVGLEQGHVMPGRERGGVGMLFFLVAALAPLFLPPLLFLLALFLLHGERVDQWLVARDATEATWQAARDVLVGILGRFPRDLARIFAHLDLATWQGAAILFVALLSMPAGRPSHVKGSRFHGARDEGDVAVVRRRIRKNPVPFLLFLAALYGAFLLAAILGPGALQAYWVGFGVLWATAVCGIALALFGAAWWSLVALDGRIRPGFALLPPALFFATQVGARLLQPDLATWAVNAASVAAWLVAALLLGVASPRRRRLPS